MCKCRRAVCPAGRGAACVEAGPLELICGTVCVQSCQGCAGGSPQKQLSLALRGLRECPGAAGRGPVQGQGAPQPRLGFERKGREAGMDCRLLLLQCRKAATGESHVRGRHAGCPCRL